MTEQPALTPAQEKLRELAMCARDWYVCPASDEQATIDLLEAARDYAEATWRGRLLTDEDRSHLYNRILERRKGHED